MAFLACDKDGTEWIYDQAMPYREDGEDFWRANYDKHGESYPCIQLPSGSIAKLIGRELTWEDEPYKLE